MRACCGSPSLFSAYFFLLQCSNVQTVLLKSNILYYLLYTRLTFYGFRVLFQTILVEYRLNCSGRGSVCKRADANWTLFGKKCLTSWHCSSHFSWLLIWNPIRNQQFPFLMDKNLYQKKTLIEIFHILRFLKAKDKELFEITPKHFLWGTQ